MATPQRSITIGDSYRMGQVLLLAPQKAVTSFFCFKRFKSDTFFSILKRIVSKKTKVKRDRDSCLVAKPCFLVVSADRLRGDNREVLFSPHKTYQVSRLKRDCHACGLKTSISRLLMPVFQFLTPGKNFGAITGHNNIYCLILKSILII